MRMLHFVDAAGTDEIFVNSDQIRAIQITSATNINVYFPSQDPAVTANDKVALTCTSGKTDEVALKLSELMVATNIGGASVLTVVADTAPFGDVGTVAYTAGS